MITIEEEKRHIYVKVDDINVIFVKKGSDVEFLMFDTKCTSTKSRNQALVLAKRAVLEFVSDGDCSVTRNMYMRSLC